MYCFSLVQNIIMAWAIKQIYRWTSVFNFREVVFWWTGTSFSTIQIDYSDANIQSRAKRNCMHMIGLAIHGFDFLKEKKFIFWQYFKFYTDLPVDKILSQSCLLPKNSGRNLPLFAIVQMSKGANKRPNSRLSIQTKLVLEINIWKFNLLQNR